MVRSATLFVDRARYAESKQDRYDPIFFFNLYTTWFRIPVKHKNTQLLLFFFFLLLPLLLLLMLFMSVLVRF